MEPKDTEQKHPQNASETPSKSRRNFIRNAGLAGLTAGATTFVGRDQNGAPANAETPKTDGAIPDEVRAMHGGAPIYDASFKTADGIETVLPPLKERVLALKQLLIEKKLISDQAIQGFVNYYENIVGPHFGAAVVAHAWKNPDWQAK
ncbi:MAG: nitrile hydratase subunit alpha [Synechocystis sp.]